MLQTLLMRASLPPLASVSCYGQCPSFGYGVLPRLWGEVALSAL